MKRKANNFDDDLDIDSIEARKAARIQFFNRKGKYRSRLNFSDAQKVDIIYDLNRLAEKNDSGLTEARKEDIIFHLNLGAKDKNDPGLNLPEAEKADIIHHLNLGEKDKNDPGLKTPAATPINEPEDRCRKSHRIYSILFANIALDYYNKKNGSKFKLVEDPPVKNSSVTCGSGIWIHCGFHAEEDSSIKKFFAEMQYVYPPRLTVSTCKVVEGGRENYISDTDEERKHDNYYFGKDRDFSDKAPARTAIKEPEEPCGKSQRIYGKLFATIALDYYNKKNCSFNAKEDSSIKRFFAEIQYVYPLRLTVPNCKVLEGESQVCCENYISDNDEEDRKHDKDYAGTDEDFTESSSTSDSDFGLVIPDMEMCLKRERIAECALSHYNRQKEDNALFFSELKYNYPSEPLVNTCQKLEEGNTTRSCENHSYSREVKHPASEDRKYRKYRGDRSIFLKERDPKNKSPCTTPHPLDYWSFFDEDEVSSPRYI